MVRVGSLVDQMLLKKDIRDNKTNLTPEEQIKKILAEVGKLNRAEMSFTMKSWKNWKGILISCIHRFQEDEMKKMKGEIR